MGPVVRSHFCVYYNYPQTLGVLESSQNTGMHSCTHTVINIFLALIACPSPAIKGLFSGFYPYVHQHSICSCCAPLSSVLMVCGGPIKMPLFDQAVGLCFAGISANSPWLRRESLPTGIPYVVYYLESVQATLLMPAVIIINTP